MSNEYFEQRGYCLKKNRMPELTNMCRIRGLPTSGRKAELVDRIVQWEQAQMNSTANSAPSYLPPPPPSTSYPNRDIAPPPPSVNRPIAPPPIQLATGNRPCPRPIDPPPIAPPPPTTSQSPLQIQSSALQFSSPFYRIERDLVTEAKFRQNSKFPVELSREEKKTLMYMKCDREAHINKNRHCQLLIRIQGGNRESRYPEECKLKVGRSVIDVSRLVKTSPAYCPEPGCILVGEFLAESNVEDLVTIQSVSRASLFTLSISKVEVVSIADLEGKVQGKSIPADNATSQVRKILDPNNDIITTSLSLSLRCPLSAARITLPARGDRCRHVQCFDLKTYLLLNQRSSSWKCPVCKNPLHFQDLAIDAYMKDVLERTSADVSEVKCKPDGTWQLPPSISTAPTPQTSNKNNGATVELLSSDDEQDTNCGSGARKKVDVIAISDDSDEDERPAKRPRSAVGHATTAGVQPISANPTYVSTSTPGRPPQKFPSGGIPNQPPPTRTPGNESHRSKPCDSSTTSESTQFTDIDYGSFDSMEYLRSESSCS